MAQLAKIPPPRPKWLEPWKMIGRGCISITTRYARAIRAVGLEIITIRKGPEPPKSLFVLSRKAALARCIVHLLPAMISIILISINLMGYFIGTRLQGWRGSDSIKLGVLQLCAKVQELLIVASLSTVIFHVVRSEMTFGPGIPLGWMGAGFRFTTLSYLWSSDLWGSIKYKHASVLRKFGLVLLLFVSGIITVLAGPSSAVLTVPRVMDWPAGGGRFWLNGIVDFLAHSFPACILSFDRITGRHVATSAVARPLERLPQN
ncbi:hypothetical protein BN1723_011577 [Verticillium longisporum]|uniref:Uncharacterized protein n=1 Tax=Verticillium longisporum TaxID=100787 RepID=A0A0G4L8Y5_VERLO|nr:hypothetical protein BN1723_011577 [Verticillium longisporum]CRK18769.1 hypothetical protein BN1708_003140 [Verticillium longisporum]